MTSTRASQARCPACGPRSTPPRSRRLTARTGRRTSARPPSPCCTARPRWSSASTSRPVRRRVAQRPAHPRELRAARRPRRKVRAACPRRHLLRHRQRARPVLLPPPCADGRRSRRSAETRPGQRGPHQVPRAGDLARRDWPGPARLADRAAGRGRRHPIARPAGGGSREAPGSGRDRPRHQTRDRPAQGAPARPGKRRLVAGHLDRGHRRRRGRCVRRRL